MLTTEQAWNQLPMPFPAKRSRDGTLLRLSLSERPATFWQTMQRLKGLVTLEHPIEEKYAFACAATRCVLKSYWLRLQDGPDRAWPLLRLDSGTELPDLDRQTRALLEELGEDLARYEPISAGYMVGEIYTALLPAELRSRHGVFYTPPALTARLMSLASKAGVEWARARVLDPGCGGGAFLTPVALKMAEALGGKTPEAVLDHVSSHLQGFELDPFGALLGMATIATLRFAAILWRLRLPVFEVRE